MQVISLPTPGLGDTTYLLIHAGQGILVDPQRDVERFLAQTGVGRIRLRYVLETHVHNDYVSGGRAAARQTGAELVLPAGAGAAFEHTPAFHLEELAGWDRLAIRPLHTPGHTPEHLSYLILVDGELVAVFSGGSLLAGSAGRTDLLGAERAYQLAVAQYRSLQRLATLPESVRLYPTHGAGSFCSVGHPGSAAGTVAEEQRSNPLLAAPDPASFAMALLASLAPYPAYYAHIGLINLLGPTPLPPRAAPELAPHVVRALNPTVRIVDGRPRVAFAAGHLPGSLGIELGDQFAIWTGWLVPFDNPLVLVLDAGQDASEAVTQLGRIGFDHVRGVLRGTAGWETAGYPLARDDTVTVDAFAAAIKRGDARQILDVRSPDEWASSHLPGSVHRYLPDLARGAPVELDPAEPVWVACASGYRASIAAGLLEQVGYHPIILVGGGIPDVRQRLVVEQEER